MTLLQKIYEWSVTLPPCLRDAIRRLLNSTDLSDDDYDDLFALLKLEAGIADPKGRKSEPLEKKHLPSTVVQGNSARLLSLQNLKNVNRIAANQKVTFEPTGLTVVYGDNGTGKSGYSRVLKVACRARGEKAIVLPNAHLPKATKAVPEAEIVYEMDGTTTKVKWTESTHDHPELSTLSVFDSHCARAYLDTEQDVAYLPYGLDIVENLANTVLPQLNDRLREDLAKCVVDHTQFDELKGKTEIGEIVSRLSAKTDTSKVEALATINESEMARLAELRTSLGEQNPKQKALQLLRLVERINRIRDSINVAIKVVDSLALERLKALVASTDSAIAAERRAVEIFHANESLLPGTGGEEWQILFEAARTFARIAYADSDFPNMNTDSRCLLCQQELTDGAMRLQRFDNFVRNNTAMVASSRRASLRTLIASIENSNVTFYPEPSLVEEIEQLDSKLCRILQEFERSLASRRKWMLDSVVDAEWTNEVTTSEDPRGLLVAFVDALKAEAASHQLASNEDTRKALELELAELESREKCQRKKHHILEAIKKLQLAAALESCRKTIRPLPFTKKSKEFANDTVTDALSNALNKEFESLGLGNLKTKLKSRAKDGKTYHKIVLDVPTAYKLSEILSEGELRVLAIASFLAELSLAEHSGGIIFDDPVSSLDHFRRARVASRLVEESTKRQVVIFTHDTVFLAELRGIAERQSLPAKFYHLEWTTAEHSGYCIEGLPWHHQGFNDRIDKLEQEQKRLQKEWTPVPNSQLCDRMRNAYSHYRATIERSIESIFLHGIVRRFDNYIPIAKMKKIVALTPPELAELDRLFKVACDVTNAHDPATGANRPPPDPSEFEKHIKELKALVDGFRART